MSSDLPLDIRPPDQTPAGIEYHGIAGASMDCQLAVLRLLQYGAIKCARIVTSERNHCLLLTNEVGDVIAIKSGFSSGYGGTGPAIFSAVLQLFVAHRIDIDEWVTDEAFIERLDKAALTEADLERALKAKPVRPSRWAEYIRENERESDANGNLWAEFPPVIPYAIVDRRIMDLAISFWDDPDGKLITGYRRIEDIVRTRTGISEFGAKLFSSAFLGDKSLLTWQVPDAAEKTGRAQLFGAVFMAYRNPRAHREKPHSELLTEFLMLNHLFRLEAEAIRSMLGS